MNRSTRRAEGDRGVTLILFALALIAIMTMVAIVIDLSNVRNTRQDSKSTTDAATSAGLVSLAPDGISKPWRGVCSALAYLKANQPDRTFSLSYFDGTGSVSVPGNPCVSLQNQQCVAGVPSTWAWIRATDGDFVADIRSGYVTPDPAFPEDATSYSGDDGLALHGGCDQLAVIAGRRDAALFGGAAGATGYDTTVRSVGRVRIKPQENAVIALLLLEDRDCMALETSGNNTYVFVRAVPIGAPTRPGLIHANSDATGACGGSARVLAGSNNCPAISNCVGTGPSIVAESASVTDPGRIGVRAVGGPQDGFASTAFCADAALPTAGCTVAPVPANRGSISRAPVDERYLAYARALKTTAATAGPSGYFVVSNCNALANTTVSTLTTGGNPKVYLDCDLSLSPGQSLTFDDTITDVIVTGSLDVKGTLIASDIRNLYVRGSGGITVTGALRVNEKGATSCTDRFNRDKLGLLGYSRSDVAKVVVTSGEFAGGSSGTEIDLCNTFLFLSDGNLPTTDGTPPSNNSFAGKISIGASASLDWRAPNQSDVALNVGDPLFADFEDMALWTERSGTTAGTASGIGGQGAVVTTGVFFLPNANPFNIGGGGSGAIFNADAQFIVRKLRLAGTVALTMAPSPNNSVPFPVLEGLALVR